MSRLIATRAIRGAHKLVSRAEAELNQAIEEKGPQTRVEFPNTGYYLPISHGIIGQKIETLGGLKELLQEAQKLLPKPLNILRIRFHILPGLIRSRDNSGWGRRMMLFSENGELNLWMVLRPGLPLV